MRTIAHGLSPGLHKEDEVSSRKKVIIDYIVKHIRVSFTFCEVFVRLLQLSLLLLLVI